MAGLRRPSPRRLFALSPLLVLALQAPGGGDFAVTPASSPPHEAQWLQAGDRVHMTGCVNGKLSHLRIDLFEEPPGTISPWVARLRGTSRKQICDGEVVIVHQVRRIRGDLAVLVEPVRQEVRGWTAAEFVGAHFPLYRCHTHFQDEALIEKCLRGEPPP